MVSPGLISARKTAWFAWLPEFGWTFAKPQPKQRLRAINGQIFRHVDVFTTAIIATAQG
jgi:hypothetical protein